MNTLNKYCELPYDPLLNTQLETLWNLLFGLIDPDSIKVASDHATLTLDDFIYVQTGASKNTTIPVATAANKGKAYIFKYNHATQTSNWVKDDASSPNTIIDDTMAQHDVILLVSTGAVTNDTAPDYKGWRVIKLIG